MDQRFQCQACGRWYETDGETVEAATPEVGHSEQTGGVCAPDPTVNDELPCVECGGE